MERGTKKMQYWKLFNKSKDPAAPVLIFRFCDPAAGERHCLERWDGTEWIQDNDDPYHLMDYLYGEAGARAISEAEAKAFISAM
jgi:hypothetical protein